MVLASLSVTDSPTAEGQVWSDGWVVDPRDDVFYVLSLIGSPTAVRTLHAAIAERAELRLTHQRSTRNLKPHAVSRYQVRSGRLPSGAVHAILSCAPSGARLVLAESEAALPKACFEDIVRHRSLMAIPEWAPWVFEALLDRNEAHRLAGPIPAVLVSASEPTLDHLVQEGLQEGAIAFPPETPGPMAASG